VAGVIYVGLQAFYEQQTRKPPDPPAEPVEAPLTEARFREMLVEAKKKQPTPQV
jgi:hypothetical protein